MFVFKGSVHSGQGLGKNKYGGLVARHLQYLMSRQLSTLGQGTNMIWGDKIPTRASEK